MDWFSLCLSGFTIAAQGMLHLVFSARLTGKRCGTRQAVLYLCLLFAIEALASSQMDAACWELLALYGVLRLALGCRRSVSCAAAVLAVCICRLSYGIIASIESLTLSRAVGTKLLYPLIFLAELLALALCLCCCGLVLRFLSLAGETPYLGVLLPPGLFLSVAELYILRTAYSTVSLPAEPGDLRLLAVQLLGLAALLSTLYAYRQVCRGLRSQAAASLAQAVRAQKIYVDEARVRDEKTRAFRHDIKNHLSVLDGLLRAGQLNEARSYLEKLEAAAGALSPPVQTGSPAVDVLLGEKLELARAAGIRTEIALPRDCGAEDFDLCVIFANALDNAIQACREVQGERTIQVQGRRQGDFYLLAFENTCVPGPLPPMGVGLSNVRAIAGKYQGDVLREKTDGRFRLHVLLNISIQPEDRSEQKPCNPAGMD